LGAHHIAAKQIIAPALNSIAGGPSKLYGGSRGLIQAAIDALVKRAIKSGDIRRDLDPFDLLRGADRHFPCSLRSRLATKRQETGGHPHHSLTPGHATGMIGGANDQKRQEKM
jgi:hypothetical protein